MLVHNLFVLGL